MVTEVRNAKKIGSHENLSFRTFLLVLAKSSIWTIQLSRKKTGEEEKSRRGLDWESLREVSCRVQKTSEVSGCFKSCRFECPGSKAMLWHLTRSGGKWSVRSHIDYQILYQNSAKQWYIFLATPSASDVFVGFFSLTRKWRMNLARQLLAHLERRRRRRQRRRHRHEEVRLEGVRPRHSPSFFPCCMTCRS